jgi:hypothetical protein
MWLGIATSLDVHFFYEQKLYFKQSTSIPKMVKLLQRHENKKMTLVARPSLDSCRKSCTVATKIQPFGGETFSL